METGVAGSAVTAIACNCALLVPHPLLETTETVPEVLPVFTVILSVVLVPDHPPGNVQV